MGIAAVVLKLASRCNLNCSYCYIYQHEDKSYLRRPKFISDEVYERTLAAMREYCEARPDGYAMALTYHGGEPTLIGSGRFDRLATRAAEVLGRRLRLLAVQTNAVLLDAAWVEVFRRHDVRVSVSLDGPPEIHDAVRVDHQGRGTHAETVAGIECLMQGGITPRILSVVNPGRSGAEAYRHFRSLGITSMDFLLPDVTHDSKESFYGGLGPTPVADFLIPAFDAWLEEDDPQVEVRLFNNLLRGFLGDEPGSDAFGNPLMSYLIVETDGAIEAMDALRVCQEGIAQSGLNVLEHGFADLAAGMPLVYRAVHEGFELAPACRECPERDVCAGGHLPHRYSRARGFDNPSAWCADILKLFGHIRERTGISAPLRLSA
ncbi:MAG TPA: radical SAM protein [Thermoanaerobaculia bacterium]|nr:radical SAM protein [Thermoanaerobaculia bacterium]